MSIILGLFDVGREKKTVDRGVKFIREFNRGEQISGEIRASSSDRAGEDKVRTKRGTNPTTLLDLVQATSFLPSRFSTLCVSQNPTFEFSTNFTVFDLPFFCRSERKLKICIPLDSKVNKLVMQR